MLTEFIRVFKGLAGTLVDASIENSEKSGMAFTNQDSIYIAQKFPFTNLFFLFDVLSATSKTLAIQFWNGQEWIAVNDVVDYSKGFTRDGNVSFSLPRNHYWHHVPFTDVADSNCPTELVGKNINGCYWLKIGLTGALDFTIKKMTYAFTTSDKINGIEKNGPKFYSTFSPDKTNWNDEIIEASEMMVAEMKSTGQIKSHGQIVLIDDFVLPCAHRSLIHIYSNMGKGYEKKREDCGRYYDHFLSGLKTLDHELDGTIDEDEILTSQPKMYR